MESTYVAGQRVQDLLSENARRSDEFESHLQMEPYSFLARASRSRRFLSLASKLIFATCAGTSFPLKDSSGLKCSCSILRWQCRSACNERGDDSSKGSSVLSSTQSSGGCLARHSPGASPNSNIQRCSLRNALFTERPNWVWVALSLQFVRAPVFDRLTPVRPGSRQDDDGHPGVSSLPVRVKTSSIVCSSLYQCTGNYGS